MIFRSSPILAALVICCALSQWLSPNANAQEWASKMFETARHDFGAVARGSKSEFSFSFQNKYQEDVHISGVRTSCGCVTATVSKNTVKSLESAEILVKLNTSAYSGQRTATVTVVIDRPYPAEVQLGVAGFIRQDVVLNPGVVRLGNVTQASGAEAIVEVSHAGRADWQIVDVRSANPHLNVVLEQTQRNAKVVSYRMKVELLKDASAGIIAEDIKLITNDGAQSEISVPLEANVIAALSVSPKLLDLGSVEPAVAVTKKVVIRGQEDIQIEDVLCDDPRFSAQVDSGAKKLQVVTITFAAKGDAAPVDTNITIVTSLGSVTVPASGLIESSGSN